MFSPLYDIFTVSEYKINCESIDHIYQHEDPTWPKNFERAQKEPDL